MFIVVEQVNVPLLDTDRNRVGMTMNGDGYSFVYDTSAGIPATSGNQVESCGFSAGGATA